MRLTLTALFSALCLMGGFIAHADNYADGVSAYKKKDYAKAAAYFSAAVQDNPQDVRRVFHLGLANTHAGNYGDARKAFEVVIQMLPSSHPMADKARTNISVLTERQISTVSSSEKANAIVKTSHSRHSQKNYLTHVIPGGKVTRFSTERLPLKVYIADAKGVPGWSPELKKVVLEAMSAWQSATRNKVRFIRVHNEENADIMVRWQHRFSDNILGLSPYKTVGNTLVHSDISLATYYPGSEIPIPRQELLGIAMHEMGHAIGLKGHSPYPEDMMYYSRTHIPNYQLSERDRNTVRMLYDVEADVQNTHMSAKAAGQYFDLVQKATEAHQKNQTAQAASYLRQALKLNATQPEAKFLLAVILHDEGVAYGKQGNLPQARKHFQQAAHLLQQVVASPNPPSEARTILSMAQKNLSLVNAASP